MEISPNGKSIWSSESCSCTVQPDVRLARSYTKLYRLTYRDKKSRVDLSAANGAVVLLAINTIAEEVSKGTS